MSNYIIADLDVLLNFKQYLNVFSQKIYSDCDQLIKEADRLRQSIDEDGFRAIETNINKIKNIICTRDYQMRKLANCVHDYAMAVRQIQALASEYVVTEDNNHAVRDSFTTTQMNFKVSSLGSIKTAQGVIINPPRQSCNKYSYSIECGNSDAFADYKIVRDCIYLTSIARQHAPRGTGSAMMNVLLEHAKLLGATCIKGEVTPLDIKLNGYKNDGEANLLYFYRKHGFQIFPKEGGFFGIRKEL